LPPFKPDNAQSREPDVGDEEDEEESTDHVHDTEQPRRRRRRRRRNSDPSSDRPLQTRKHRRRHHNASRSPSPENSSSDIEILPDRFDKDGRPLDRYGMPFRTKNRGLEVGEEEGVGQEMVERFTREIGDVMEGKKSWVALLRDIIQGGPASPNTSSDDLGGGKRRRR
jgi:hypothetical protein